MHACLLVANATRSCSNNIQWRLGSSLHLEQRVGGGLDKGAHEAQLHAVGLQEQVLRADNPMWISLERCVFMHLIWRIQRQASSPSLQACPPLKGLN